MRAVFDTYQVVGALVEVVLYLGLHEGGVLLDCGEDLQRL